MTQQRDMIYLTEAHFELSFCMKKIAKKALQPDLIYYKDNELKGQRKKD